MCTIPPHTLRQMPMARHYTTEVKGFRSNPSQRSCLEKGHTEDICKPTLAAPQLRVCLQIYKWFAWLEQHTLACSVPKPNETPCCHVCSLHWQLPSKAQSILRFLFVSIELVHPDFSNHAHSTRSARTCSLNFWC